MPRDPCIRPFLEQAGLLTQAGSVPGGPMVLLAELQGKEGNTTALA